MNYFSFFNQSLKKINYQTKLKIFLLSFFVSIIVSIFYSFYFITQYSDLFLIDTYNIIVKKIPFGYGDLLNNLIEYNKYANTEGFEFYLPGKNVEYLNKNKQNYDIVSMIDKCRIHIYKQEIIQQQL